MFSFFRKKPPQKPETYGQELNFTFRNEEQTWEESVHLLDLLERVLSDAGHTLQREGDSLLDTDRGFVIDPQFLTFQPHEGAVQTTTIITVSHPELVPESLFEYQHATGEDTAASLKSGFEMWEQTDFVVLKEALLEEPGECTTMVMEYPDGRKRRMILGPVAHLVEDRAAFEAANACPADENSDQHPFCPCCLLTRSLKAFKPLIDDGNFYGIRMFASRDETGRPDADCRVNGHDHKPGMSALRRYARTWEPAGTEFRKQYVVIQSI